MLPSSVASFPGLTRLCLLSNELFTLPRGPYQQSLLDLDLGDDPNLQIE